MNIKLNIRQVEVFSGHTGSIYSLAHLPDEDTFFTSGGDGIVAKWNLTGTHEGIQIVNVGKIVYSMEIDSTFKRLFAGQAEGGIHVIDLSNRKEVRLLQYHSAPVFKIKLNCEHDQMISLDGNGEIAISNLNTLELVKKTKLTGGKLRSIDFNKNNTLAAVGNGNGQIHLFELSEWNEIQIIKAHKAGFSVNALKFSPDGNYLLSGSRDAHLNIFDVRQNFQLTESIPAHNYAIYSIAYSPDKKLFATASRDKTIKIWDAVNNKVLMRIDSKEMKGHINSVNALLWHDSGVLVSAGDDRSAIAWEIQEHNILSE